MSGLVSSGVPRRRVIVGVLDYAQARARLPREAPARAPAATIPSGDDGKS